MKVRGGRGRKHCTFVVYTYVPMNNSSVSVIEESFASLKENVLGFKEKGREILQGDFNVNWQIY